MFLSRYFLLVREGLCGKISILIKLFNKFLGAKNLIMRIVLISTPIGFLGSGKGGGVEITLNSLVSGLLTLGHSVEVIAPKNSKLHKNNQKAKLHFVDGEDQISWQHQNYNSPVTIPDNSLLAGMLEKAIEIAKQSDVLLNMSYDWLPIWMTSNVDIPIAHIISMGSESSVISNLILSLIHI